MYDLIFLYMKKHAFRYLTLSHVLKKYPIMLFVRIRVSDGGEKRKACGFYSRSISELATHV